MRRRRPTRRSVRRVLAVEVGGVAVGGLALGGAALLGPNRWALLVFGATLATMAAVRLQPEVRTSRFDLRAWAASSLGAASCAAWYAGAGATDASLALAALGLVALVATHRPPVSAIAGMVSAVAMAAIARDGGVGAVATAFAIATVGVAVGGALAARPGTERAGDEPLTRSLLRRSTSARTPARATQERMIRDAGRSVRESLRRTLELTRAALRGQTAIALWIDHRAGLARVRGAETASDHLLEGPFSDRAGILGVLRKRSTPLVLNEMDFEDGFLPWYATGAGPTHVVGMGLYDEGRLVGYLLVDRAEGQPAFDDVDAIAVRAAAEEVIGSLHTERLVVDASRSRHEMAVLYEAADALNRSLTPEDVCATAADLVRRIADADLVVVTRAEDAEAQTVVHADGYGAEDLRELSFGADASLAALALRRQHALPYSGRLENPDTALFGEQVRLPELRSVVVFPMTIGQRCIGTFSLGSLDAGAWDTEQRDRLRLVVTYVGAALANAFAYSHAITLATTDGMTGLTNHRTFKDRGAHALDRCERSGRPLTVIMTDIDHFKKVNDTYGHAMGDEVLKAVAHELRESLRKVDIGARYGGEEFAVVLEDTTTEDAARLAERIRERVQGLTFESSQGPFSVTLSLGVATWPRDGADLAELVDAADQALYRAKRGGRNQVVRADDHALAA